MQKHSHEISDILARPPRKLVSYGTVIAAISFIAIIALMWYISYPDQVNGRLSMTTTVPPISVIANSSGHVTFKQEEGAFVKAGEELGHISDGANADLADITALEQQVNDFMEFETENFLSYTPDLNMEVGELQLYLDEFNETISSFKLQENDNSDKSKIRKIRTINQNKKKSLEYLDKKILQLKEEFRIANDQETKRQERQNLQDSGDIEAYNTYLESLKALEIEITELESNKLKLKTDIESGNFEILSEEIGTTKGSLYKLQEIRRKLNALNNAILSWRKKYRLLAPADGKVTYYDDQLSQQLVRNGDVIMAIVPTHTEQDIIGKIELPLIGSGKVEPGQRVLIKFDTYPFLEYGAVEGKVKTKSLLPKPDVEVYSLTIELPKGLVTSRGDSIAFRQNMLADAEIITEEARLIERVFGAAFSVFD